MADRWHVIEQDLLPDDPKQRWAAIVEIRTRLLAAGHSRAKVAGCVDFLLGKAHGDEVPMPPASKSTYRKMLAALAGVPDRPPDETGSASVVALAAVAGVLGTMAAIVGHTGGLLALAPIIQDSVNPEDELSEFSNYCCEPPLLLAA